MFSCRDTTRWDCSWRMREVTRDQPDETRGYLYGCLEQDQVAAVSAATGFGLVGLPLARVRACRTTKFRLQGNCSMLSNPGSLRDIGAMLKP